jgi:hypothetical protein
MAIYLLEMICRAHLEAEEIIGGAEGEVSQSPIIVGNPGIVVAWMGIKVLKGAIQGHFFQDHPPQTGFHSQGRVGAGLGGSLESPG